MTVMKEFELEENLFKFETNDIILPINFDGNKFYN
jgi:hypothetical protein